MVLLQGLKDHPSNKWGKSLKGKKKRPFKAKSLTLN